MNNYNEYNNYGQYINCGKYDPYEWTTIAADDRKDMIYLDDEYTSQMVGPNDPITYYTKDGKLLECTIAAIDEKIIKNVYHMNLSLEYYDLLIGLSIKIPHKEYSDCYVTISRAQEIYKRPEKIVVAGQTNFKGTYLGTATDSDYNDNATDTEHIVNNYGSSSFIASHL